MGLVLAALMGSGASRGLHGQLISPGKLTSAHGQLEGMRNCTQCHELRKSGIQNERCLTCHEPLAKRVEAGRGYHAHIEDNCASCHKEHFGREFEMIRFESEGFDHLDAGYELAGAHTRLECRDCHTPDLITAVEVRVFKRQRGALDHTYMGLGTVCLACHRRNDPHRGQFEETPCSDCHTEDEWNPAVGFEHDRARFRLTGKHRQVECEECHAPAARTSAAGTSVAHTSTAGTSAAYAVSETGGKPALRYRPLAFARCTDCHEDFHEGDMGPTCTECHGTAGWDRIDRNRFEGDFDHEATGYSLLGAHGELECGACHQSTRAERDGIRMAYDPQTLERSYPRPAVEDCVSCHLDYHEGVFRDGPTGLNCDGCHGEDGWLPSTYDLFRHNREADFELTGAHLATSCVSCHEHVDVPRELIVFEFADVTCVGCHTEENPHDDQFQGQACDDCHVTDSFELPGFDHDATAYPLDGAHRDVACGDCHLSQIGSDGREFVRYKPLDTTCRACHEGEGE